MLPSAQDIQQLVELAATCVAWGIGLSAAFWIVGYTVWFIVQFFR